MVFALAAAMRVVNGVHDRTTDCRTDAYPARAASLTDNDVAMLCVANSADGGTAGKQNTTQLRRGHTQDGIAVVLAHKLDGSTCRASDCCALTRLELHGVHEGADGDLGQRHSVARLDVDILGTRDNLVAYRETLGCEDIGLGTIDIVKQCNTSRAVGVVLNGSDLSRYVVLAALKINATILALVAATLMTGGDAAIVVTACLFGQGLQERLFGGVGGDLGKVRNRLPTPTGARGLEVPYSHSQFPSSPLAIHLGMEPESGSGE